MEPIGFVAMGVVLCMNFHLFDLSQLFCEMNMTDDRCDVCDNAYTQCHAIFVHTFSLVFVVTPLLSRLTIRPVMPFAF